MVDPRTLTFIFSMTVFLIEFSGAVKAENELLHGTLVLESAEYPEFALE